MADLFDHSNHGAWRRWRITHWLARNLYTSGITASGGGYSYSSECSGCLTSLPRFQWGERPYVLWVKWGTWRCLLRGRHFPGEHIMWGYCGKCLPCPDCGSKTAGHEDGCPSVVTIA